jgi:hypothetical protein
MTDLGFGQDEVVDALLPRKTSKHQVTGGWDENSKALERTRLKELGKMTP